MGACGGSSKNEHRGLSAKPAQNGCLKKKMSARLSPGAQETLPPEAGAERRGLPPITFKQTIDDITSSDCLP
jgi:hypothetical protein